MTIFNHLSPEFYDIWKKNTPTRRRNRHNGAWYYSKEICKYFIPTIETDRNWYTVTSRDITYEPHSIVIIHDNTTPIQYRRLAKYDDLILVCSWPETMEAVKDYGQVVYLPMSVDTKYLDKYKTEKTKETAYAGRSDKIKELETEGILTEDIDFLQDMPRKKFLAEMAKYKNVYAIDRVAIEARYLGCKVLPFDPRFPDPDSRWPVLDSRDAAKMLQKILNEIDK